MKVIIGKHPIRWRCCFFSDYMNRKYGYVFWSTNYTYYEKILEKIEDIAQWFLDYTVNIIIDRMKQKVHIHVDPWDTWSMDHTLAPIILLMLKQLRENKQGGPYVDYEDVPEDLRPNEAEIEHYKNMGQVDIHFFARWDWVMNEMIYAFDCKANKDDPIMRFEYPEEKDEMNAEQDRISNGFRLFGKYYEALWD